MPGLASTSVGLWVILLLRTFCVRVFFSFLPHAEGLASQTASCSPVPVSVVPLGSIVFQVKLRVLARSVLCHSLVMALPVLSMDEDLVRLLTAPKPKGWALLEDVVAGTLKNEITSIPMFAKGVDSEKELKPAFLTPTSQENSMAEASKLKLAWEAACLVTEKISKRGPEMDLDSLHELDTPLALAIQEDLERSLHQGLLMEWVSVCNGRVWLFVGPC